MRRTLHGSHQTNHIGEITIKQNTLHTKIPQLNFYVSSKSQPEIFRKIQKRFWFASHSSIPLC